MKEIKKFEYLVVAARTVLQPSVLQEKLNDLGKQGWELILCVQGNFVYKRVI